VDWLEYARLPFGDSDGEVTACWFFEGPGTGAGSRLPGKGISLATPEGWRYEGSLSSTGTFVPTEDIEGRMRFLRRQGGVAVLLDTVTGKELFLGTTQADAADGA
jgi:hypothetical protein